MKDLDTLQAEITAAETVIDSATTFINGTAAMVQKAVDQALANGATAEELAPVVQLGTELQSKADALAAAITANTPAAPDAQSAPVDKNPPPDAQNNG